VARAKKTVIVSDLSGREVAEAEAVRITISFADKSRGRVVLDASQDEVAELASKGRVIRSRGGRDRSGRAVATGVEEEDLEYVGDDA